MEDVIVGTSDLIGFFVRSKNIGDVLVWIRLKTNLTLAMSKFSSRFGENRDVRFASFFSVKRGEYSLLTS